MRLLLNSWMVMISLVLSCHHLAEGFSSPSSVLYKQQPTLRRLQQQQSFSTMLYLVTEDDVLEAVETAEKLWAEALEARKTANALSDRAEEEAEAAATQANEANEALLTANKEKIPVTLEQLAQGDAVARSSLDAGSMVNRALQGVCLTGLPLKKA